MDFIWGVTICANTALLCLLLRRTHYLTFFFLCTLVSFNVLSAPVIWYVYAHAPDYYRELYSILPWVRGVLWFAVVLECHFLGQRRIALPIEIYAFITLWAWTSTHLGLVNLGYWINQGMRIFNLAVIFIWITMFYPKKEATYYV